MMKKCSGCGTLLQNENPEENGYIRDLDKDLCERCFRIKNYGDYKVVDKTNNDFIPILKEISKTKDLVVLLVDIFSINKDLSFITKNLDNDILLVFTKRDIMPLSLIDEKLLDYSNYLNIKCIDKVIISSDKNYELDNLYEKINKYKKSSRVYIVGYTNAGKSTMINKLIYNYTDLNNNLTTSILPSTTLDTLEIKLNDELTIVDTPGIIEEGNIINYIEPKVIKNILPTKEIKPITYQVKDKEYFLIKDLLYLEVEDNNITFFVSNKLKIERFHKKRDTTFKETIVRVKENEDVVISGLGFIKTTKPGIIKVYTANNVDVYARNSLI